MNGIACRLHHWLRMTAPPDEVGALFIVGLLGFEAFVLAAAWLGGDAEIIRILHQPRDAALLIVSGAYGIWRVAAMHPAGRGEYLKFLARTPWRRGQPLPLGPVHLVWQDVVVLAVPLAAASFATAGQPAAVIGLFLFAYLATLSFLLGATGQVGSFYAVWFGLGLAIRLAWINGLAPLAVLAITYFVAGAAYWSSLRDFPWQQALAEFRNRTTIKVEGLNTAGQATGEAQTEMLLPWPYTLLGSSASARLVHPLHAWVSLSLLAWLLYAASPPAARADDVHQVALPVLGIGSLAVAGMRLLVYVSSHWPPLSTLGRLSTGRLIIPRYDVVFLTPLVTGLIGLPLYAGLQLLRLTPQIALAIAIAAVLGVALTGPPRLRYWRLTAPLRIWPVGKVAGRIEAI